MAVFIVSCAFGEDGDRNKLHEILCSQFGAFCFQRDSWMLRHDGGPKEIRGQLLLTGSSGEPLIGRGGSGFVIRLESGNDIAETNPLISIRSFLDGLKSF
jgi:hypothetical protein